MRKLTASLFMSLDGVIEADYGEWTGGQLVDLAKTDLWKTV